LAYIERTAKRGGGMMRNDNETYIAPASCDAMRFAAGAVVTAVEAVLRRDFKNAFALVRPPGHHAFREHGEGFCLINNVAIAADTARHDLGMDRVLIVDFDVHHGNGTQAIFYDDPTVLFFSMQQWGIYPGTGHWSEIGSGAGTGYTVNVPLLSGTGDDTYIRVFDDLLIPIARRFKPDLILVSAGYDPHWADPLASMAVTDLGFFNLAKRLVALSEELCGGRLVLTLEGGYGLEGLAYGVVATFTALLGEQTFEDPIGPSPRAERPVDEKYLGRLRALHGLS
jgi:acetoin utilization deacetylase AcuC-like enzyme